MKKLHLKQFGRFGEASFDIAPLTIFFGSNETGKSTIADAIFEGLCQPDRRRAAGKRLTRRYGKDFSASISSGNETITDTISEEEYLNLFAIHASDLTFEVDETAPWSEVLRDRLYGGGISCQNIINTLVAKGDDDRRRDHNKKLALLETRRQEIKGRIDALLIEQEKIRNTIKAVHETGTQLDELNTQAAKLDNQISAARLEVERLQKWTEFSKVRHGSTLLFEVQTLKAECQNTDLEFMRQCVRQLNEAKAGITSKSISLTHLEDRRQSVASAANENEQLKFQENAKASRKIEDKVREHLEHIGKFSNQKSFFNLGFLGFGLVAFALLSLLLTKQFLITEVDWSTPLSLGLLLLGFALLSLQARRNNLRRSRLQYETLSDLIASWNAFIVDYSGGEIRKLPLDLEIKGYQDYLERLSEGIDADSPLSLQLKQQGHRLRDEFAQLEEKVQLESQSKSEWQDQFDRGCSNLGVKSAEQAENLLRQQTIKVSRLENLIAECTRLNLTGVEAQVSIDRQMRYYTTNPPIGSKPQDPALVLAEADKILQRLELERRACSEKLIETKGKNEGLSGEVRGRLRDLPNQLVELEIALSEVNSAVEAAHNEKMGARLASEIFTEISKSTAGQFEELATEVTRLLKPILPQAIIEFSDLKSKSLSVTDQGGVLRPINQLSSGTKDLYILGCRLAIATCTGRHEAILTLDDPFVFFDSERQIAALEFIGNLITSEGWAGVLFTKDRELLKQAKQIWPGSLVHDLDAWHQQPANLSSQKHLPTDTGSSIKKKSRTAVQRRDQSSASGLEA